LTARQHRADHTLQHRAVELLLAAEVVVDERGVLAGRRADLLDRRGSESLHREELLCGVEDLLSSCSAFDRWHASIKRSINELSTGTEGYIRVFPVSTGNADSSATGSAHPGDFG